MEFSKIDGCAKKVKAPAIELAHQVRDLRVKKSHCTKRVKRSATRQQQQSPSSQPIWRKTILVNKPKPKTILPRIFRADRKTGLPLDYERTVSKIMRYVNPQASKSHSPDQLMEELLSQTLVGYLESYNRTNGCVFKHHMHMILQNRGLNIIDKDVRNDENLLEFHCACKRKPLPSANIVPTYQSKFNYNNLKIKSK